MSEHSDEFTDAEDRDPPPGRGLRESDESRMSGDVFWRFLAVRVNENVGVDRNQLRASICSYSMSLSSMLTPATGRPHLMSSLAR